MSLSVSCAEKIWEMPPAALNQRLPTSPQGQLSARNGSRTPVSRSRPDVFNLHVGVFVGRSRILELSECLPGRRVMGDGSLRSDLCRRGRRLPAELGHARHEIR
jgi:hypothetical protein